MQRYAPNPQRYSQEAACLIDMAFPKIYIEDRKHCNSSAIAELLPDIKGGVFMPSFANPFCGNVDRKLSNAELMQALRLDIAGELEAIFLYDAHYLATDDPAAKAVLADIRDEEKIHMGELITLMCHLDPKEAQLFLDGEGEVKELLEELGITETPIAPTVVPTVGSLVDK